MYLGFQKSSGIKHAANYSGIKLSTPPLSFDPRKLAASIVRTAKNPTEASYPDWPPVAFKSIYKIFPGVVRYVSSAAMQMVMKKANKGEKSKGNMGIDGKSLFTISEK
ncbi:hypothetical protein H5J24_09825 [Chryseobacterium capnotolerans]|uniref:hypothetical protein n=1 Tax=Chryseobacterium TaxID=59732 RepID=UPI00083A0792|nr:MULTISPECIES: hypothetical protein [Chryseobacterium]UHO40251.1 hypothetical protein H5J24_09825 [Chryseobacterium capnotolerans]